MKGCLIHEAVVRTSNTYQILALLSIPLAPALYTLCTAVFQADHGRSLQPLWEVDQVKFI